MKTVVVALGGNAIKSAKEKGTYEEQKANVERTMVHVGELALSGWRLVITHGNGPQVGSLLIQQEAGKDKVPAFPMHMCGALSQGQIGYLIQQALMNKYRRMKKNISVATVVTQVIVDKNDSAFTHPTKPVGPFYFKKEEITAMKKQGFTVVEDSGRGYRRVVPSPIPIKIAEIEAIKKMVRDGIIVIASGGGGIPVIEKNSELVGVDAVIDKDRAGQVLATALKANFLFILTDVEKVSLFYRSENQINLDKMTIKEAEKYLKEGHFAAGSMGPKVQASVAFIKNGGKKAIITHPFKVMEALAGKTGTVISK